MVEENLKKAEENFRKASEIVRENDDQDSRHSAHIMTSFFTEANYHLLSALYHQNEAIIRLLQKKD